MREIKFRAYHKIRKEMYSVHGWHSEYVFKETLDGIGCEGNPDKLDDVELMQFTGLKDKNGTEIYEGDIIPMSFSPTSNEGISYGSDFTLNGVVEFCLPHQAKYIIKFPKENKYNIISCEFGWGSMTDLEVIGNIHEHNT